MFITVVQAHCNSCGRETKHAVRTAHSTKRMVPEKELGDEFEETETLEILQCLGCDSMVVRQRFDNEARGTSTPRFYPPRISRREPRWKDQLPWRIDEMVGEVYRALQTGSRTLATMGARTVIDMVVLEKVGDVGSFDKKVTELEAQGFVSRRSREFLSAALEAGNAAAHRGALLGDDDLNRLMEILENILESVYVLEHAAQRLREVTPPRRPHKR